MKERLKQFFVKKMYKIRMAGRAVLELEGVVGLVG